MDRNLDNDIRLGIRFHHHDSPPEHDSKTRAPAAAYPPGEIEWSFSKKDDESAPYLRTFSVGNIYGGQMLMRRRSGAKYTIEGLNLSDIPTRMRKAVRDSMPNRFLFSSESIIRAFFQAAEHASHKKTQDDKTEAVRLEVPETLNHYMMTLSVVSEAVETILSQIKFVGPLRDQAKRVYELTGEHPRGVGVRGEFTAEILFRNQDPLLLESVNRWLAAFNFGFSLRCEQIGAEAFCIKIERPDRLALNLADTGFGLSQILPLIVECLLTDRPGLIIAEQPEIHLNPKLQATLADLFVEVANAGKGILVETHSEHLLLRLRQLIADKKISANDVSLLYAEKEGEHASIRSINIDKLGHIKGEEWPKGFFEESLRGALALASAQVRNRGKTRSGSKKSNGKQGR